MAKIISFAWTTAALLAGHKSVTRRDWDDSYAARFKPGEIVQISQIQAQNGTIGVYKQNAPAVL